MAISSPARSFRLGDQKMPKAGQGRQQRGDRNIGYRLQSGSAKTKHCSCVRSRWDVFCFVRVPTPVLRDAGASTRSLWLVLPWPNTELMRRAFGYNSVCYRKKNMYLLLLCQYCMSLIDMLGTPCPGRNGVVLPSTDRDGKRVKRVRSKLTHGS